MAGPGHPWPGSLTASQVKAALDDIVARRAQLQALQEQLAAFDEQLAALQTALGPLHEWAKAWSGMEQGLTRFWQPPGQ